MRNSWDDVKKGLPILKEAFKTKRDIQVTGILILINLLVYILLAIKQGNFANISPITLFELGGIRGNSNAVGIVPSMFMHLNFFFLLINIFAIFLLGLICEYYFGRMVFVFSYLFCGICGGFSVILFGSERIVATGAFGAVFGLTALIAVYALILKFKWKDLLIPPLAINAISTLAFLLIWMADSWHAFKGHLGGLVGGCVLGVFFALRKKANGDFSDIVETETVTRRRIKSYTTTEIFGGFKETDIIEEEYEVEVPVYLPADPEKLQKRPAIVVLIITGVLVLAFLISNFGNASYTEPRDYLNKANLILKPFPEITRTYNNEIVPAELGDTDVKNIIEVDILPPIKESLEKAERLAERIQDPELQEIHALLIEYLTLEIERYETLYKAFDEQNSDYIVTANELNKTSGELFTEYKNRLEMYNEQ
jgi:rhomboid protease GluP